MKRWLFNLAAALSLLLSLAAAATWAMSYARPPGWRLIGIRHSAICRVVVADRGAQHLSRQHLSPSRFRSGTLAIARPREPRVQRLLTQPSSSRHPTFIGRSCPAFMFGARGPLVTRARRSHVAPVPP